MRQDISVDPTHGELNITENLANKTFYDFILLDDVKGMDNDRYCFGEIVVPVYFETRYKSTNGIRVTIPYSPHYKELQIRFRLDSGNGETVYLLNRINNQIWFPVFLQDQKTIRLSEFCSLSEKGYFNFIMKDGYLLLFSANESDMLFNAAMSQNEVFLLKATVGNLYQHPRTGVGLIDYLHGNFENTGLAAKLQSEFENDKMIINNAYMDSLTGELYIDAKEKDNG